ncbi:hypothetical protein [Ewingella americana]|uniref:Uncharacterized protein n=1 Tax=Ewingella americana TaxID=41202 RepID=A0A502GEL3_9GAMM|nr:hypothetical protein [Ewingella americana]TPG59978.1 hypothetical protein EAH77_15540 [Ewingella americana]
MTSTLVVRVGLLECPDLHSQITELFSANTDFSIEVKSIMKADLAVLTAFDILICEPHTALHEVSDLLYKLEDSVANELLISVVSSEEDLKYVGTLIKRVALRKDGFRNLAVYFNDDSMLIVPRSGAEKLKSLYAEDITSQNVLAIEYPENSGEYVHVSNFKPLLVVAPEDKPKIPEFNRWMHWLNSFGLLQVSLDDSERLAELNDSEAVLIYRYTDD